MAKIIDVDLSDLAEVEVKEQPKRMKATVQRTGRLGLTNSAVNQLGLKPGMRARIMQSKSNPDPLKLFMELEPEGSKVGFRINKAGEYHYIATQDLFDTLPLDYKGQTVIYDLFPAEIAGRRIIVMEGRVRPSKAKSQAV